MKKSVQPVPAGYHTITPYLIVDGGVAALEFYKKAFGAIEKMRMERPDGKIGHSEILIGDSPVMVADACPTMGSCDPHALNGRTPVLMHLYVENVDTWVDRAAEAGAKIVRPVTNQFYGDRSGMVEDPFGHLWCISTHQEDVAPDEMARRFEELCSQKAK